MAGHDRKLYAYDCSSSAGDGFEDPDEYWEDETGVRARNDDDDFPSQETTLDLKVRRETEKDDYAEVINLFDGLSDLEDILVNSLMDLYFSPQLIVAAVMGMREVDDENLKEFSMNLFLEWAAGSMNGIKRASDTTIFGYQRADIEYYFAKAPDLVAQPELLAVSQTILKSQRKRHTPKVLQDILAIAENVDVFRRLPDEMREIFKDIAYRSVARISVSDRRTEHYAHLGGTLKSMETFTGGYHRPSILLARKLYYIDTYDRFSDIYKPIGRLDPTMSSTVFSLADRILDFLPEGPEGDEEEVTLVKEFLWSLPIVDRLPAKLQGFVSDVLDGLEGLSRINGENYIQRHDICRTVKCLEPFTGPHNSSAVDFVIQIHAKDPYNILVNSYKHLGKIASNAPQRVLRAVDRVISLLPVCDYDDVPSMTKVRKQRPIKDVTDFIRKVGDSFEYVEVCELETFFKLYQNSLEDPSSGLPRFRHVAKHLSKATGMRRVRKNNKNIGDMKKRVEKDNIGVVYLAYSYDIMQSHDDGHSHLSELHKFAEFVSHLSDRFESPRGIRELMDLYVRAYIRHETLDDYEEHKLAQHSLDDALAKTTERARLQILGNLQKRRRKKCPRKVVDALRRRRVDKIGDLVDLKPSMTHRLFADQLTLQLYEQMEEERSDNLFLRSIVRGLHGRKMLEPILTYLGACCGTGKKEIEIYDEFRRLGYQTLLDLLDRNREALVKARHAAKLAGVSDINVYIADVRELEYTHMANDRQVVVSVLETAGNLRKGRLRMMNHFREVAQQREYVVDSDENHIRRSGLYVRKKDLLIVDGWGVKHEEFYMKGEDMVRTALNMELDINLQPPANPDVPGIIPVLDREKGTMQIYYYVSRSTGNYNEGDVIGVINSDLITEDVLYRESCDAGLDICFLNSPTDRVVGVLYLPDDRIG